VVIGVHSGKYIAERETSRIREATLRYDIGHPVLNDRQFRVWRSYAIRAWPSLVVIDRNGYVVGSHAGEFTAEMLDSALRELLSTASVTRETARLHFPAESPGIEPSVLRYPGKVTVDGERIAISDTGNHRVIIGRLETVARMQVEHVVTAIEQTGGVSSVRLDLVAPQGLAFDGANLYVADSGTHTVSAIETENAKTRLLAGIGAQMRSRADQVAGALSSPWDVTVIGQTIFVAMAGVHQIWAIDSVSGATKVHSGTGAEDILDGPNASALLAQPMSIAAFGDRLYFADAESSAIRWADVDRDGNVGTIVGTGLFDFGDVDGIGDAVRMQHPQGVAIHPTGDLIVADSYNDSLKLVNPSTRSARTWLCGFHEPAGIAAGKDSAYIADTNAHRIMVADYTTSKLSELTIIS
jgi:DNA-binding beta-propeller fold protein YncE